MKNFKKLAAIILTASMVLGLAGCSSNGSTTTAATTTTAPTTAKASSSAQTDTTKAANGKFIIGTSADFAPYEFHTIIDGKDTIVGADMALAKAIADDMGKELEIVDMDFNILLAQVDSGAIDAVIACLSVKPERLAQADFSNVYYSSNHVVLIKKDSVDKFTSAESFKGATLAAQTGSVQEGHLSTYFADSTHVVVKKVPDEVAQLKQGKVDGVILDEDVAKEYAAQNKDLAVANFIVEKSEGTAVAVKKGNTALLTEINKTVDKVVKDNSYSKWLEEATEINSK